jgi:RNA methyltransferase, TrmH family
MPEGNDRSTDIIISPANPGIKMTRSLQRRKNRMQERAFVVEGLRAVNDVLEVGIRPRAVYLRQDVDESELERVPAGVPVRRVANRVFDDLTDVAHPQGVLAVVPMLEDAAFPEASERPLVMILDAVRDPGNLGTLLRSAAGAGVDHVVIGPESVDPYHPRAVRAAMGAHLRIPFSRRSWADLAPLMANYPVIALADAGGETEYDALTWSGAAAIIVGGEAFGPSTAAYECATHRVSIPLANGVESLNAGVAGSLLAFEAARQRRSANGRG